MPIHAPTCLHSTKKACNTYFPQLSTCTERKHVAHPQYVLVHNYMHAHTEKKGMQHPTHMSTQKGESMHTALPVAYYTHAYMYTNTGKGSESVQEIVDDNGYLIYFS